MEIGRLTLPPLRDEELKRVRLRKMKRIATGLLAAAALLFVVASVLEGRWEWMGYVRATAEAAMVGAIADWFAVTALFRYPLGVRIPHTAIIPNNKERIGRSLGHFVQNNFLSPAVIIARLRGAQVGQKLADWLADPLHGDVVGKHSAAVVAGLVQVLRDEEVQEAIESSLVKRVRATQMAPLLGRVLTVVTADNRHQELLDSAIRLLQRVFDENRDAVRSRIGEETPWWVPTAVDDKIYEKISASVRKTLHEVSADPDHPARAKFNEAVAEFVERLRTSPELIARGEGFKEEVLQHPAVREYSGSIWADLKASLLRHSADPESEFRVRVGAAVTRFGQTLREDPELMEKVDGWIEQAVLYLVDQYRHEAAALIESTVSAWDPEDTTEKIELQIGRDLQFIRINGTLVGGLVGLLIYTIAQLLAL